MPVKKQVFAGHDNELFWTFTERDGVSIDLSTLDRVAFEMERNSDGLVVLMNSVDDATMFRFDGVDENGDPMAANKCAVKHGHKFTDAHMGEWEVRPVLVVLANTNGVRNGKPLTIEVVK